MGDVYKKALEAYKLIFGKVKLNTFEDRLQFQKTIYLLKIFGVNFQELNFTWYKRGPYCFDLAGIGYKKAMKNENNLTGIEIKKIEANKTRIIELMTEPKEAELFSSVAYLYKEENLKEPEIVKRMNLTKPWFDTQQVELTIKNVKKFLPQIQ